MKRRYACRPLLTLAAAALSAVLLSACGGNHKAGEDTSYPYSWTENKDGSVTVIVRCETEDDCIWEAERSEQIEITAAGATESTEEVQQTESTDQTDQGEQTQQSEQTEQTQQSDQAQQPASTDGEYTITALTDEVSGVAAFTRRKEGGLEEQVWQISLSLQTDSKGKLEVIDTWNGAPDTAATESAGEDTEAPYQWCSDGQEGLRVYVTTADQSWQVTTEGGSEDEDSYLTALGPDYDAEGFLVTIRGNAESGTVALKAIESGIYIELDLTRNDEGSLTVTDHREGSWERAREDIPGMTELEEEFGTVAIPQGITILESSTSVWEDGADITATVGHIYYQKGSETRSLEMAADVTIEELIKAVADESEAVETQTGEVGDTAVTICLYTGSADAFWENEDGIVCRLYNGGNQSLEELLAGESSVSYEDMLAEAADWIEAGQKAAEED